MICNHTCHFPCAIPDDANKINCAAMVNGQCVICKGKCVWTHHQNMKFHYNSKMVKKFERVTNLYNAYLSATSKLT